MSKEGRVIVRSPSCDPTKIAGSPHWHPAIQACLLSERRGIVALVRRLIWKKFPERTGARAFPGGGARSRFRSPHEPKLFWVFSSSAFGLCAHGLSNHLKIREFFQQSAVRRFVDNGR